MGTLQLEGWAGDATCCTAPDAHVPCAHKGSLRICLNGALVSSHRHATALFHPAAFLQWKALLGLLLCCERAPLQTSTGMYVAFLGVVRQQLALGLGQSGSNAGGGSGGERRAGGSSSDGSKGEAASCGTDAGACPLGLPLVEELLPDSFLRRQFASFFLMLHEGGCAVPTQLVVQVRLLGRGSQARAVSSCLLVIKGHACAWISPLLFTLARTT